MKNTIFFCVLLVLPVLGSSQNFAGESVEYDPSQNRFFSSSNGGSIVQRAQDGTVSFFGSGLLASYGMEVMNNTLFAIDGSHIYGYDLDTETQVMEVNISGSSFLNGMASDGENRLWVTDFSAKRIHEIDVSEYDNPTSTIVVNNTVSTPNGIVHDDSENRLIFVNWGTNAPIKQVNLSNYEVSTILNTSLGNIDGIDKDGFGNFYLSSWSPNRITRFDSNFSVSEIISAPGISNPADICYAQAIDTLAIPNNNGTVTFVGFSTITSVESGKSTNGIIVAPNPLTSGSFITFELLSNQYVRIVMTDVSGRESTVHSGQMSAGSHRVLLSGYNWSAGQYILRVERKDGVHTQKVLVQ